MTARIRAFGRATLAAALTLVTAVGLLVVGAMVGTAQPAVQDLPAPRHPGADRAGKTTVAFVLGASGSDAADVLAPFEVFASSPAVRAYTVAASSAPAALGSGLAIIPDHTFADIEQGSVSRDTSGATLRSVAKMLEYPLDRVGPPAPSVAAQWRTPLLLAAVAGLALGAGSLPYLLGRRRPSRKRGPGGRRPATASAAVRPGRSPVVR